MWRPFKRKRESVFTGNCMVWQYTGDGDCVGPCWYSTYNGFCWLHGDVSAHLDGRAAWPNDYDLAE